MEEFFQHIINGLSIGSIYALIALGYSMVFGVLKFINFAHSEVYMVGAFTGYYTARGLELDRSPSIGGLLITLVSAMLVCALLGLTIERLAYRPLRRSPRLNILITAVGVSLLLQYLGQLIFGPDPKFFPTVITTGEDFLVFGLRINRLQLLVFCIALLLTGILQYFVFCTRSGRAMRAVSFNPDVASLMGISTNRVVGMTFLIGSALAGAAGVLVGLAYPKIEPLMGMLPGLKAFVAAVLGGIGNVTGAVLGALLIGLAETMVVAYGAPTFRDALAFAILIGILWFRPTGILGEKGLEKV